MQVKPLTISHYTLTNALGLGKQASLTALQNENTGLTFCDFLDVDLETYIGKVDGVDSVALPEHLKAFDCRNNRLALLGLQQDNFEQHVVSAVTRYGNKRVGVFMGTSTSGILTTEQAYQHRSVDNTAFEVDFDFMHTHNIYSVTDFIQQYFNLSGPGHAISTACSSSIKVFASAYRHMQAGLCDAAIVGGVDSLCLMTLYGFNSLQLISEKLCRPWDAQRNGINIGEAAGFALLEWPDKTNTNSGLYFKGYGESSDAYHMSTPHPQGRGAQQAMQQALRYAGLDTDQIDYINLHGTATKSNDAAEDAAIKELFGADTACSSTKGWTGHTLGAAGITEAGFSCLALQHDFIPGNLNTRQRDPALSANINLHSRPANINTVLSNSFGFGGSNCSVIFGKQV